MKYRLYLALFPLLIGYAMALTPVSDDFSGLPGTNLWTYRSVGKGTLTQAGGRLNYAAPAPVTAGDHAKYTLNNNRPGYNEDWQVTLDVYNAANRGEKVGVGISIFNSADRSDHVNLEFYGAGPRGGFNFIGVTDHIDDPSKDVRAFLNFTTGRLRVTFSGKTKLFTFWYDNPTAGDGVPWTKLCTFSTNGVGGTRRGNWNMNPAGGTFGVRIYGFSESQAVPAGVVSMDRFQLRAGN